MASTIFMISYPYIWCHTHCVYDNTSSISDLKPILFAIISTVYIMTPTLSKTSLQLCKKSQVAYECHHMHYTWHHIHTLWQQPLVFMTSHALYSWHHMHYMWHVISCVWYHVYCMCDIPQCIYDITPSTFITSYLSYMIAPILLSWQHNHYTWNLTHYIWPHVHCICVITPNLSMISQPIYVWYHIQYSCHVLSTKFKTSYTLCMTSQHCVLMTPHSAYIWHLLHYRWHHIHSITPNHSIYDVTSTSGMTSHPSYPL